MRARRDRGQATVETALVLPFVVMLLAAIVWIAQLVIAQVQLEHAAREGARAAAVEPGNANSAARAAVAEVDTSFSVRVALGSQFVEVTVSERIGGVPLIGVGTRELSADVVMRREDRIEP